MMASFGSIALSEHRQPRFTVAGFSLSRLIRRYLTISYKVLVQSAYDTKLDLSDRKPMTNHRNK